MALPPGVSVSLFLIVGTGVLAALLTHVLIRKHIAPDEPNERSLHRVVTPRGGGVAMVVSIVAFGLIATVWWSPEQADLHTVAWMLGLTLLVSAVSYFGGDHHRLSAFQRLIVQAAIALTWTWQTGSVFEVIQFPGLWSWDLGVFGWALTVAFIVWTMNLFNFMDGMDGLAGSMVLVGCSTVAIMAYVAGHSTLPLLAALGAASALGFLLFNYPPALIFMGDAGSVALGFFVAALITTGARDGLAGPLTMGLAFAPFFVDASVTLIRRMLRGERFWVAHRTHWYQRFVLAGWSHRRALHLQLVLMLLSAAVALSSLMPGRVWPGLLLAWTVPYAAVVLLLRRLEVTKPEAHASAPAASALASATAVANGSRRVG